MYLKLLISLVDPLKNPIRVRNGPISKGQLPKLRASKIYQDNSIAPARFSLRYDCWEPQALKLKFELFLYHLTALLEKQFPTQKWVRNGPILKAYLLAESRFQLGIIGNSYLPCKIPPSLSMFNLLRWADFLTDSQSKHIVMLALVSPA
jgi:hypothetical protein